jgi:hypothetical protein
MNCLINETENQGVYSMHRTEHRIDLIVEPNDMGDDAHIENHISPLCVSKSSENESQGDLSLKENRGAFERFYKAKYMQGMSEIQIKNHHDLFRFNDYANEYWHNIVNRQWHAWNARQPEISAMQIKVDELQKRVDLLEGKIKEALNTVYAMKGKADCDHLTDKEQSFVYGFGYELHEILKEEQSLKGGAV